MLAAQAGIKAAGEEVVTRARGGDAVALSVIDAWARWLAIGLVNLTNVLDPERIILGGGLVVSFDVLFAPLERWFGALLYAEDHRPRPTVVPASLGDQAGAIGAALLLDE